jgi:hypothetical protein
MTARAPQARYLVEHYRPGLSEAELKEMVVRVRAAVDCSDARLLSATIVPRDHAVFCLVEGPSERAVRGVYTRAGISFERISTAVVETLAGPARE